MPSQFPLGPFLKVIIAANVLVHILLLLLQAQDAAFAQAGFVPFMATAGQWLTLPVPTLLTPLTAAFVHSGLMHLALNMLMFLICGKPLEAALGWRAMAVLYVIGAYVAAAVEWAFDPYSLVPMVGASGAISAVIGAYALVFSEQKVKAIGPVPGYFVRVLWLLAAWTLIQFLFGVAFGLSDGMSLAVGAHIGGFLAGLVLVRPLLRWRYHGARF